MIDLEDMKREVELRYNISLDRNDPLIVAIAANLMLVTECVETLLNQNKALMNELQKTQAALRTKNYQYPGVDNSSN
jgi:hypothetical protein